MHGVQLSNLRYSLLMHLRVVAMPGGHLGVPDSTAAEPSSPRPPSPDQFGKRVSQTGLQARQIYLLAN
ncbi:hypothetical protein CK221_21390 [Mesorhizobium sp. WSM3868]|nr:hypothetical protein CK221_21390 [Mesorhizobium sp. WSM3868]